MKVNQLLVKKAQKGDHEAFIQLIQEYELILYKMARRYLGEEKDIEDCMQETVLTAFANIRKLKNPAHFNTWLCRILINECKKLLNTTSFTQQIDDLPLTASAGQDRELGMMLEKLPEKYRLPLILYYLNGFSIKEIGEILDQPAGTVKSQLSRGKEKLKKIYEKKQGGMEHGKVRAAFS